MKNDEMKENNNKSKAARVRRWAALLLLAACLLLVVCAVSVNLTKSLLQAVIIFLSYSSIMCILWVLMESPDLAITEAAVGAGISGVLFLMTLKKIHAEDTGDVQEDSSEKQ